MDISDLVSGQKFKELNATQKEELYGTLLTLAGGVQEIPKKSLRKTLEISLAVLRYKGGQVSKLKERLDASSHGQSTDDSQQERLLNENDKLKRMLEKLEDEKVQLLQKSKELANEIFQLQKRLQDAANSADGSDKDSSDPLSQLDKQEELLHTINTKNKHIKRLLKEIESLQNNNIEQSKTIIEVEKELQRSKLAIMQLSADLDRLGGEAAQQQEELMLEIKRLEGNVTYLEDERDKTETELQRSSEKWEKKALAWKAMVDKREEELRELRAQLERRAPPIFAVSGGLESSDDSERETTKLMHAIETRDKLIDQLESKIKEMATEMIVTTQAMNMLTADHTTIERVRDAKSRECCKTTGEALKAAQVRCLELSDMLERCEEDNQLKATQALHAVNALEAYQRGEDGLVKVLRKCASLEQKLVARDKQIKSLFSDLNSLHELEYENGVLRKRLQIPDDVVISAKNMAAKERSKDKVIDRLTLKLRASEEMRLQLKLEKSDMRKEMMELQQAALNISLHETTTSSERSSSEVGEIKNPTRHSRLSSKKHSSPNERSPLTGEMQAKYEEVIAENETLRQGMHEILDRLREYNAYSDHITIDAAILDRLLQALQAVRKEPEQYISPLTASTFSIDNDELPSVETVREGSGLRENDDSILELPNFVDSSTRPTTPNQDLDQTAIPVIEENSPNIMESEPSGRVESVEGAAPAESERTRQLHQELEDLKIYRHQYEELQEQMSTSEEELMQYCALLAEQVTQLKLDLSRQNSSCAYMRVDFDRALAAAKQVELHRIQGVADLRREIMEHQQQVAVLQANYDTLKEACVCQQDDYVALKLSKAALQAQLAHITDQLLAGELAPQFRINDICADYGVIQENLQLDYITAEEYAQQTSNLRAMNEKQEELRRHTTQLEGLLEIAHDQIKCQQKMLNDITDNHMNLRHLVADLQSTTEDKLVMAKMHRDLDSAKSELTSLHEQRDELQRQCEALKSSLSAEQCTAAEDKHYFQTERKNKDIKIRFLLKTIYILKEKYCKFTPLIFLTNFLFSYAKFIKSTLKEHDASFNATADEHQREAIEKIIASKLLENRRNLDDAENLVKFIRAETHNKLLEENFASLQAQCRSLQEELTAQRLRYASESEHWQTIEALFNPNGATSVSPIPAQTSDVKTRTFATNTDVPVPAERKLSAGKRRSSAIVEVADKNLSPLGSPQKRGLELREIATQTSVEQVVVADAQSSPAVSNDAAKAYTAERHTSDAEVQTTNAEHLECQSVQSVDIDDKCGAKDPASDEQDAELLKKLEQKRQDEQAELSAATQRIEELERRLEALQAKAQETPPGGGELSTASQESGIIEKTIISFHTLLTEKDKSISEFKDLLQFEREQLRTATTKFNADIEGLKSTVTNLNFNIKTKDMEILELKTQLEVLSIRRNSTEKLDLAAGATGTDDGGDNSLHELSDEKIEEMFQQDAPKGVPVATNLPAACSEIDILEKQDTELLKEVPVLIRKLKEMKDRTNYWENTLKVKEEEIALLREKLNLYQEREKSMESNPAPEIEQMRSLVEEKDKHINELIETLNSFHDDQQRYIDDSSNYSADKISKLAADLTRTEATNKIYQTQVEALRRQLTTLTQREKQAREVNQSLRSQLIKRPVVSIKTELNARVKTENLQKRIHQLESELDDTRAQVQRQQVVLEAKRARSAVEVGLWEKQKRWQQNAEKFKARLDETECTLEKTRSLLQSARNSITRLEKDKQALELKLGRVTHVGNVHHGHNAKCCRTSSCPNIQQNSSKYTPSESPETFTGVSSVSSSPVHSAATEGHHAHHHDELIEALKARLELQQRKLLSLELEGKGSNALTTEMEKMQDKFSAIEAQNIRLEAKNLQLQLDNDVLRQGDASDRLQKRIKHLEDYIIALKEEMAQTEARGQLCKCSNIRATSHPGQAAEQTILKLRAIVEKLRSENKYLKDGRRSCESRSSAETPTDISRLQQMYAESLDKISALQLELNVKPKCPHCSNRGKIDMQINDELKLIKEQLVKKTQLLQKAKVLLTRAAAKEKVLKEQLTLWKRKCSELQNVPVIDEISE